ncbi:MAG TPA: phosphoribosylanthranilate isomerase [Pseudonocardiaceae bacterium]
MRVKICGATRLDEVALLAKAGADFVGLWHGVPGGRTELSLSQLTTLAATKELQPILVTLLSRVDDLVPVVREAGIDWVQLHGYQQPGVVRALKAECPNTTVVKVLHIKAGECVERALIKAYQRAGVDVFLLDALAADGRIGSTAQTIDPAVAERIIELSELPVMLAGGLTASNSARFRSLIDHPRFFGIDVDSGARDEQGRIDGRRVAEIRNQWTVVESK